MKNKRPSRNQPSRLRGKLSSVLGNRFSGTSSASRSVITPQEAPARAQTAADGRPPLAPDAGGKDRQSDRAATTEQRVLLVTAFELPVERMEKVMDTVETYAAERNVTPVILTDCAVFEIFRRRRLAFEYLPPRSQQRRFASYLTWSLYIRRRFALLQAKWQPIGIISFGTRLPLRGAVPDPSVATDMDTQPRNES